MLNTSRIIRFSLSYDRRFYVTIASMAIVQVAFITLMTSKLAVQIHGNELVVFGTQRDFVIVPSINSQLGTYAAEMHGWMWLLIVIPSGLCNVSPVLSSLFANEEFLWLRLSSLSNMELLIRMAALVAAFPFLTLVADVVCCVVLRLSYHRIDIQPFFNSCVNQLSALTVSCGLIFVSAVAFGQGRYARVLLSVFLFLGPMLSGFVWWVAREWSAQYAFINYLSAGCPFVGSLATGFSHWLPTLILGITLPIVAAIYVGRNFD